jgi:hypothetical protein
MVRKFIIATNRSYCYGDQGGIGGLRALVVQLTP